MKIRSEVVTVFEAAQQLRLSEARIRSWIARELLPVQTTGAGLQAVALTDVARLMASRRTLVVPR